VACFDDLHVYLAVSKHEHHVALGEQEAVTVALVMLVVVPLTRPTTT
jgi:hypothetical protein